MVVWIESIWRAGWCLGGSAARKAVSRGKGKEKGKVRCGK